MDHGAAVQGARERRLSETRVQARCHGESIASPGGALALSVGSAVLYLSLSFSTHSLYLLYVNRLTGD